MEREKKLLLAEIHKESDKLKQHLSFLQTVSINDEFHSYKSSSKSTSERIIGNNLYIKQTHDAETHCKILVQYNKSIAYAFPDSEELALAHANRSAFLLHVKKYENSTTDIDAALIITKSKLLQFKLLCRKIECFKLLGSNGCEQIIDSAQSCLDSIVITDKTKLNNQLEKVKSIKPGKACSRSADTQLCSDRNAILKRKEKVVSKAITIKYDKKYGRQLVANKDFRPGEIIFTEKPFVSIINDDDMSRYMFCENCLKRLWSAVPCRICQWAMYCSENCRTEACEGYHKVECDLISKWECLKSLQIMHKINIHKINIHTRLILKAVEEFGSFEKLQLELKTIDGHKDPCVGFIEDEKIVNTFRRIYSLSFNDNDDFVRCVLPAIPYTLIFLTQNNFIKNWELKQVEDLITNEDMVFLGTLILRISLIYSANKYSLFNTVTLSDYETSDDTKGYNLGVLSSLINHSCYPNASWNCSTENNEMITYAVQPIKKNEQIFITYLSECRTKPKNERLIMLFEKYNFICTCKKCTNDWPPLKEFMQAVKENENLQWKGYDENDVNIKDAPAFAALYLMLETEISMERLFEPSDDSFKKCF